MNVDMMATIMTYGLDQLYKEICYKTNIGDLNG
jgi:hypothetical protein